MADASEESDASIDVDVEEDEEEEMREYFYMYGNEPEYTEEELRGMIPTQNEREADGCSQKTLGSFHQGRPADPGEGGSARSGHLLLFVKEFYCSTRTHGGGGV